MRLSGLISLLLVAACASSIPRTVPRVVNGRIEDGPAVSPYAYEWFIEGERLAAQGRHDEAAMAFEAATQAPTGDVLLVMRLAEEYELSGASRRADRAISLAHRYYPGSPRVPLTEGRIRLARGDLEGALAAFADAGRLAPGWSAPSIASAEALAARGHVQRAEALLLAYLEGADDAQRETALAALISLARRQGDAETLQRALAFDPHLSAERRASRAAELALAVEQPSLAARILGPQRYDAATVDLWLRALAMSGDRESAARYLASGDAARFVSVEERAGRLVELGASKRALELLAAAERSPQVEYTRGRAMLSQASYLDAASVLAGVPFGTSTFEGSRLALAECAESNARVGAAAEALSTIPYESLAVRTKLAHLLVEVGELRAALRLFDPKQTADRAVLASLFERVGRFDEAHAYYATVKVTTGSTPRLRARVAAEQLASRGLRKSAIAILERWAFVAPEDLYSRVRLVELLQYEQRSDEARRLGRDALPLIGDPALRAHLTEVMGSRVQRD